MTSVGEHGVDLGKHSLLGSAAVGVQLIEFVGERAGAFDVARGEELDDFRGDVHAAGGVDARADAEANVAGSERATCGVELRDIEQGAQPGVHRTPQAGDAKRGDDAVLAEQRDCIRDGGDDQHLQERGQQLLAGALGVYGFKERLGQLECHARAAEMLAGVGAIGLVGVEDGERLGKTKCRFRQVMIGDDEVQVEARGFIGGGEGANAGVHADDEAHAFSGGAGEHLGLHAVAVAETMGDVVAGGAAENLDGGFEQDNRGGAVDVIVAVDEDRLARRDGLLDARDGGGHAVQSVGVEQVVESGMEKLRGGRGVGNAALDQQGSDRSGNAGCRRESLDGGRIKRWKLPMRIGRRGGRSAGCGAHACCLTRCPRPRQ